jgi:hypothetical protein
MKLRNILITTTALIAASGAHGQTLGYPISGLYIGAAGGFNLTGNESFKNLSSNLRTFGGSSREGTSQGVSS